MWKLLLVALFLTGCASTPKSDYIRTTGTGASLEEAKQMAFREAVQIRVGTLVLSERESNKYGIVKDDILVHSAGYVDDYKVINSHTNNRTVTATVDVLVADSKLKNHILSTAKSTKDIDGMRHGAQYSSYMHERVTGDKILDNVLKGYPKNAYKIKQEPYTISINSTRQMVLNVPYEISWNYEYIQSLNEVLGLLEDGSNGWLAKSPGMVTVMAKDPKDYVFGKRSIFYFNDVARVHKVQDAFTGVNDMRIKMTINDYGINKLYSTCLVPLNINGYSSSFYAIGQTSDVRVYGNTKEKGVITYVIPSNLMSSMNRASNVELSIVAQGDC